MLLGYVAAIVSGVGHLGLECRSLCRWCIRHRSAGGAHPNADRTNRRFRRHVFARNPDFRHVCFGGVRRACCR